MGGSTVEIALYVLGAVGIGGILGWLLRASTGKRDVQKAVAEWRTGVDAVTQQKERLNDEAESLRSNLIAQQTITQEHEKTISKLQTDFESANEKTKLLSKDLFNLRAEREGFKTKVATFQNALIALKRQSLALQEEFHKSGEVYKRELAKAFEKRKALELKVDNARLEQESFNNLLQASRSEQESINNMLASARNRLEQLDALEQAVIKLEAENAQLNHDAIRNRQENDALQRDLAEMDELKVQNRELAHCLESMENSRRQYENDAKRYRENAGEYEKRSETLLLKLDEVEKNFAEMEKQQREALKEAREATATEPQPVASKPQASSGATPPNHAPDDLKDIIGIGKVFEHTLHELGIYTFEQIANFGLEDIARVNAELKEFKGRMEQDDWIGQARELHFKKYGQTG